MGSALDPLFGVLGDTPRRRALMRGGGLAFAVALGGIGGLVGSLVPLALGLVAGIVGLGPTMWVLLLAPLALGGLVPARALTVA